MAPLAAIKSGFAHYASSKGRASRSEFWWFFLFFGLVVATALYLAPPLIFWLTVLALLLPFVAVSVRRLHDTGRSGWWYLLFFVPFGGLVVYVFWAIAGEPGPNRFGPSPATRHVG